MSSSLLDEDSLLVARAPEVTPAEAEALARTLFGIEATAEPLTSERDRNFHLRRKDGCAFVLKVANAAEAAGIGAFQAEALQHIAKRDPALPVPRVHLTRDGASEAVIRLDGGSTHRVRVVGYLPGRPLAQAAPSVQQAEALGRCLAALGLALRDFRHPAAGHEILWDLEQALHLRPLLSRVADADCRARAMAAFDRYAQIVRPLSPAFRTQVVHNDFNPNNVLSDPDDPTRITGVLDFGDMVHTALVHDLAVAAAYQVEGPDPLARPLALARAYHAVSPLLPVEVDSLFDLIALRHVLTVTIGERRASLHPENRAYLLRHRPRAAAALASLAAIGPGSGRERFRQACGTEPRA